MGINVLHSTGFLSRVERLALLLVVVLLSLTSTVGYSQVADHRPRIGLVLSGGGAIGFSQIGVLAWLEEHHIPVDYIAGTEVGGWVGGSYATGMSATEISQFLQRIDFGLTLFLGDDSYQEKGNWNKSEKVEPPGLPGLQLDAFVSSKSPDVAVPLLPRIAHSYPNLHSFDELPTPFRCLAVDLTTGSLLVLNNGSLPEALRATTALIGVSNPVHRGHEVLVSGGILNSIPTDVVRKMGADIVIVSFADFLGGPGGESEFSSPLLQMARTLEVARMMNEMKGLQTADIVIRPHPRSAVVSEFNGPAELVKLGYDAAQEKALLLLPFAVSDSDWQQYQANRQQRRLRSAK
jgi:NTE family protein